MKIAVNTRLLENNCQQGYGNFLYGVWSRIAKKFPEHEFIFIFDRAHNTKFLFEKNITPVITSACPRHPLLRKLWYDIKITALLKKHKADIFVSCDGWCSHTTKIPQCLVVPDLSFLHSPSLLKKTHLFFYKRYTRKFFKKATGIATLSAFSKKNILSLYPCDEKKIDVIPIAVNEIFSSLTETEKEAVKQEHTEGKNYFIYADTFHSLQNLTTLLRAFSIFKKRQKSDWKLVLTGNPAKTAVNFLESLKSYRYRTDIVLINCPGEVEHAKLLGSAYTMVYPSYFSDNGISVLQAFTSQIPVITSPGSAMEEIAGNAALYADPSDHKDIAEKMMLLYKDETLRNDLIEKGKLIALQYNWDKAADLLWQSIHNAIK